MKPTIIGIAGGSGSGKTTLAEHVLASLGAERCVWLRHDDYYKPLPPGRAPHIHNFDEPAALESSLLATHLQALRRGQPVDIPRYAFDVHARVGHQRVEPRDVLVVEGILLFTEPAVRDHMDIRVFVHAPREVRLQRRMARDVLHRGRSEEDVLRQFTTTVEPMHQLHVEPTRDHAHLVVDGRHDLAGNVARVLTALRTR